MRGKAKGIDLSESIDPYTYFDDDTTSEILLFEFYLILVLSYFRFSLPVFAISAN